MEKLDEDLASCGTPCLKSTSRAKLSWRKTKTGRRRRARQVRSGVTLPNVPTVDEEERETFLEKIDLSSANGVVIDGAGNK
eukprot:1902943-Amphidinium_carterae.1